MKKWMYLLLALVLVGSLHAVAFAHEVPDLTRRGSVKIFLKSSGGSMTMYRAGDVWEENGDFYFSPAEGFENCGLKLESVDSADLAAELARYVRTERLKGITKEIKNGSVIFEDLEPGLYLFLQEQAAEGYRPVNPFLVSVPVNENGRYLYDIDAAPKVEDPDRIDPSSASPSEPGDPTLPQTGQLNWPVTVLAAMGLGMMGAGWVLKTKRK